MKNYIYEEIALREALGLAEPGGLTLFSGGKFQHTLGLKMCL